MTVQRISLAQLREGVEITSRTNDGDEIVWCGEGPDGYIGWTPRETADRCGYVVHRSEPDPTVLALVEAVEAARFLRSHMEAEPDALTSEHSIWLHQSYQAEDVLDSHLAKFDFGEQA
jgi:hypothetical protein